MIQITITNVESVISNLLPRATDAAAPIAPQPSTCIPTADCFVGAGGVRCLTCRFLLPRERFIGDRLFYCRMGHLNAGSLWRALDIRQLEYPTPDIIQIAGNCNDYQAAAA